MLLVDGVLVGLAGMDDQIAQLIQLFHPGDRVRAIKTVAYETGEEVPKGSVGYVQHVYSFEPLVTVAWDNLPPIFHPCSVESTK